MGSQNIGGTRRPRTAAWALLALLVGASGLLAAAIHGAAPAQDPLNDAFARVCSNCHDPGRITQSRRTRVEWEDVIYQMIDRGAAGSDQDYSLVLQYLLRDFGRVNVNQAASEELALVLGLTPKEADAIVAYRKANGEFKDFEGLLKVPDLDPKKLEARRPAVLF
jgi:competence protein ComEA